MKRNRLLIYSILILALSFFKSWYSDQLIYALFIFAMIPNLALFVAFNNCLILCLKKPMRETAGKNMASLLVLAVSVALFAFFPFREAKVQCELHLYTDDRLEVIEQIKDRELLPDERGNVTLRGWDKRLSTSGEAMVYQNDDVGQVIGFWVFRGMLSGSVMLVYSTGGEGLITANEKLHPIANIDRLRDNWYYVETGY